MSRTCFAIAIALVGLLSAPSGAGANARDGRLHWVGADTWTVSGTLDGVVPPEYRTVEELYVDHVGPNTTQGLLPLAVFKDLRHLHLEVVAGVDLSVLSELPLETLSLKYVRNVDLAALGTMPRLEHLLLFSLRDVVVPSQLALPGSLRSLSVVQDGWRESGRPAEAAIRAADWSRLSALDSLVLRVGGNEPLEPVQVDLGFLRVLPTLTDLRIGPGVHHRASTPSPLAPPFDGLSRRLRRIEIDTWKPSAVRNALKRRYPRAVSNVRLRTRHRPGTGSWQVMRTGSDWHTYGSLWEAADGRYGLTENEALQAARRRLRRDAPTLLRRLDFDQEAGGTGIAARSRRDLLRALEYLGIR